jgi:hypothetical protein
MKASLAATLVLVPFAASCEPSLDDLTSCQAEVLAAYFNAVHAPERGLQGKELANARHRLETVAAQCAWPATGINIQWWRNISSLEIAVVAHDSDQIRAALDDFTSMEISEWKRPGKRIADIRR